MKNLLVSIASFAALTASAVAADIQSTATPNPPADSFNTWKGLYVGLSAGGIWGNASSVNVTTMPVQGVEASDPKLSFYKTTQGGAANTGAVSTGGLRGFIGGGQFGYNEVFRYGSSQFVSGIELDLQGIAGGGYNPGFVAYLPDIGISYSNVSVHNNTSYIGTARGRLGYLITPNLLLYSTGGLAYGYISSNFTRWSLDYPTTDGSFGVGTYALSTLKAGWTAGGGGEWMFRPNWSLKAEYLYYDLGTVSMNAETIRYDVQYDFIRITHVSTFAPRFNGNIARAGVNYHFNMDYPSVVAKF